MNRLRLEAGEAATLLAEVDPTDWKEVARCQNALNRLWWYETSVDRIIKEGLEDDDLHVAQEEATYVD